MDISELTMFALLFGALVFVVAIINDDDDDEGRFS
jgi:hypothetical protein